jgi:hypothetical protein
MKKAEPEIQPISFFSNDFGVKMQEIAVGAAVSPCALWRLRFHPVHAYLDSTGMGA